jgi:IclR family mhp operon transcriptional activator
VLGCITMRFTRSTMSEAAVGARFGPLLQSLAASIAADAHA